MVLESLIGPQDAESHPWKIALLAFGFATVAVLLAGASGFSQTGIIIVGLSSLAATPFLVKLFDFDVQNISDATVDGTSVLSRNFTTIVVMLFLFVGMLAGYVFWMLYLPQGQTTSLFDAQFKELTAINPGVTGNAISPDTGAGAVAAFQTIFFHNLQVLALVLFLSLVYGAGAIIIISWNASVIAAFLSSVARNLGGVGGGASGLVIGLGTGVLGILPHGTLELCAYLIMAVAGGLVSKVVIQDNESASQSTFVLLFDAAKLVALSLVFLALAAVIESNLLALS